MNPVVSSPLQAQAWLQHILRNPEKYEGRIVAIAEDESIVAAADSFHAAREAVERLGSQGSVGYFSVPRDGSNVRILTLRLRSLREDIWSPMYDVALRSSHGELPSCRMLVDSGADISLISQKAGNELGLQRSEEEELLSAQGIGGRVSYLMRRLAIVIDGHSVSTSVAWCQDPEIDDMILGRKDIFDAFNIEFRQREGRIVFMPVGDVGIINL
jgi:hypothetical protein